jgi:hypothetical protein
MIDSGGPQAYDPKFGQHSENAANNRSVILDHLP